jgi:hypothetical protein
MIPEPMHTGQLGNPASFRISPQLFSNCFSGIQFWYKSFRDTTISIFLRRANHMARMGVSGQRLKQIVHLNPSPNTHILANSSRDFASPQFGLGHL